MNQHRAYLEEKAREVGRTIKGQLPSDCGFLLLMFDYGEDGWLSYMGTARRPDTANLLRDFADRLETSV